MVGYAKPAFVRRQHTHARLPGKDGFANRIRQQVLVFQRIFDKACGEVFFKAGMQ